MPMPMPEGVDHISYVVPGLVDGAVVQKQAEERYSRLSEVTVVHYHKDDEPCPPIEKRKCRIYTAHKHDDECREQEQGTGIPCDLIGSWYIWAGALR